MKSIERPITNTEETTETPSFINLNVVKENCKDYDKANILKSDKGYLLEVLNKDGKQIMLFAYDKKGEPIAFEDINAISKLINQVDKGMEILKSLDEKDMIRTN